MARRKRKRSKTRRNAFLSNPRKRRGRRHRRNPFGIGKAVGMPGLAPAFKNLAYASAGYMATKGLGNIVVPMIPFVGPFMASNPLARVGGKLVTAFAGAWLLDKFLLKGAFTPMFLGGSMEIVQDVVKTYVGPFVPQLAADDDMSAYPELSYMGAYADVPAMSDYDGVGADSDFDGASD